MSDEVTQDDVKHPGAVELYSRMLPVEEPDDEGNEPIDGSYPPDGEDVIHALEVKARVPRKRMTPPQLIGHERRHRAMQMRIAGLPYAEIAKQLGYAGPSGAAMAVRRAMKGTQDEDRAQLRSMTYNRLNDMLSRAWPLAIGGYVDPTTGQRAQPDEAWMIRAQAIMKQMVDLMGAAAPATPTNVNVSGQVQHSMNGAVQVDHTGVVVHAEWDEEKFIAEMRRNTAEGLRDMAKELGIEIKPPSGYIAPALTQGEADKDAEIIEANVVDEETGEKVFDPRKALKL